MPSEVTERDADIAYFGPEIANRHFYGVMVPCLSSEDHEWVNLPALARELDEAFGKHGFHTQAFMHVQNAAECASCGKRVPL